MTTILAKGQSGREPSGMPAAVAVGLLAFLVYLPALSGEFVGWDDDPYVVQNQAIHRLTGSTIVWAFTNFHSYNWHPLTWLSHALDYAVFGAKPFGHHLTSIVLHALNAALLCRVFWRLTAALAPSAMVAALFALHPLHVESVAWVAERKDVLSTLFWLATMAAYVRYAEHGGARRYAVVVIAFVCGLLSKPMVVTLPFVLLLLDFWPLRRLSVRAIVEKVPLLVLSAVSAVITMAAQRMGGAAASMQMLDSGQRIANAVISYARYLAKMLWPAELVPYYPYQTGAPAYSALAIGAIAVALALSTVVALKLRNRFPYLAFGWLWYLGTLVPVIGVVQVGMQSIADRYTYVPLIGIFVMLAWGGWELATAYRARPAIIVASGAILIALSILTVRQIGVWHDPVRLWRYTVSVYPEDSQVRYNTAAAVTDGGDPDAGAAHYRRAIELQPNHFEALDNLANYHYRRGELDRAEELYQRSIAIAPDRPVAYTHLGALRTRQDRLEEAVELFRSALARDPEHVDALNNLGVALVQQNDLDGALEMWNRALTIDPASSPAHMNLGRAYELLGDPSAAMRHYEAVLQVDPRHAGASGRLAVLRNTQR